MAAARGGQRAGRVGRDELEVHLLGRLRHDGPEAVARGEHPVERVRVPGVRQEQVEESGPGDLDAVERVAEAGPQRVAQALGDIAGLGADDRREHERGVRRVVAVAGLLGPLERRARARRAAVGQPARRRLDGGTELCDRRHVRALVPLGANSSSRRSMVRPVPIAITTSPACRTVSTGGWGWNWPDRSRTPTMIAPPRTSPIAWPSPPRTPPLAGPPPGDPGATSISSIRYSGATSSAPRIWGFSARRAISEPLVLYGEITRVAPARRSLASTASSDARATIATSGRRPRTVSVMKMLSASESTQAITPRARMTPAARRISSSDGSPSMKRVPTPCAWSRISGLWSTTT